ncbi:ABC transporter substrate-binding protein [Chloroflexota bacterium]
MMNKKRNYFMVSLLLVFSILFAACTFKSKDQEANTNEQQELVIKIEKPIDAEATEEMVEEPTEEPAATSESEKIELTDGLGRIVILEESAQRVIALAPSNIEILFEIGAGDLVVGREDFANYPPEVVDIPSIGGTFGELNLEAILALEPDLVLVAELTTAEQVQAMEDLGITVFQLPNPVGFEGLYENMRSVAKLVGREAEAEEAIAKLEERVQAVLEKVANAETRPLVFYELDSTDPNAPWTAGGGTFIDTVITMAGGENMGAAYEGAWVQLSAEEILTQDPDFIILGDSIWGVMPEDVAARPGWGTLSAVQNGQVYPFNDDLVSRPGPRLVQGLEEMAKLIHPELFE